MPDRITSLTAREILAGSGWPTVEVCLSTERGQKVTASAPAGTSTGKHEARALYDGGSRYQGKGVLRAVGNVERKIAPAMHGLELANLEGLDQVMLDLDGTPDKSNLGANAILPVSVACAKALALAQDQSIFQCLADSAPDRLPVPIATVIAGGSYSPSGLVFEDYLYIMRDFACFAEALEALVRLRFTLQSLLVERFGPVPEVGGALAPPLASTQQAFEVMLEAAKRAGLEGRVGLGLDVAASEFYLSGEEAYRIEGNMASARQLAEVYQQLERDYPLVFLEDPFHEDDFTSHAALAADLPGCRIVGDDLFASHPERIARGVRERSAHAILLKINQIGTVSQALRAAAIARRGGLGVTVSLRSNETNDDFIADLAVALGAEQIKLGSPVRGERNAKYNRLLAIEEELGPRARFAEQA
jgi:enolase